MKIKDLDWDNMTMFILKTKGSQKITFFAN